MSNQPCSVGQPLPLGISFVVTVYNKAEALPKVLASLKAVELTVPVEFIFVDDGSTDQSLSILRNAVENWPEARAVTQKNAGPSRATNTGIFQAKYQFLKLVDGDDCLTPWGVAHLLALIQKHRAVLVFGEHCTERQAPQSAHSNPRVELFPRPLKLAMRRNLTTPSPSLMDTAAVQAFGGCDEREFVQDASLCLRCALAGAVVRSSEIVSYGEPEGGAGRVSANKLRERVVANRTLLTALQEYPEQTRALRAFALRRAAGRTWHWVRRHHGGKLFSPAHRLYLTSLVPWPRNYVQALQKTIDLLEE